MQVDSVFPLLMTRRQLELCCVSVQSDFLRDVDSLNQSGFDERLKLIGFLLAALPQGRADKLDLRPMIRDLFAIHQTVEVE